MSVGSDPAARRFDFAAVLAELGLDPVHAQRAVDPFFRLPGDTAVIVGTEQAVFIELEPELHGAVAHADVVRLRAREVLHRGAAALGRNQPQVGLIPASQSNARLRIALAEDALDMRVRDEGIHQRWLDRRRRGCRCRRRFRVRAARLPTGNQLDVTVMDTKEVDQ